MSGGRGAARGGGKKKKYVQPFQIVSVRASEARCGKGGDETTRFQSFPGESGTSFRGKGDSLASPPPLPAPFPSPPPPEAPRACLWHPRSHCPGSPCPCQPQNFLSSSSFASRQSQGEPEELLGPGRGLEGGAGCLHLRVNTRCPLPSAETVCVSFSLLLFVFCFFFFFLFVSCPSPPPLPPLPSFGQIAV